MVCGIITFAGDLEINGNFKDVKGKLPKGWAQSKSSWAKPLAEVEVIQAGEGNVLKVTSGKETKMSHVYFRKATPVKAGDKVKLTIKVKGKGRAGVGIYVHGHGKWCFGSYKNVKLTDAATEFVNIVTTFIDAGEKLQKVVLIFHGWELIKCLSI